MMQWLLNIIHIKNNLGSEMVSFASESKIVLISRIASHTLSSLETDWQTGLLST
jgi:hypothetical protein